MIIIINTAVILFAIMSLASLSGLFSERSGVVNIGINGMMIFGAVVYWKVSRQLHGEGYDQIFSSLAALGIGTVVAIFFGFAVIQLNANQIISGTAINMISSAVGLVLLGLASADEIYIPDPAWSVNTDNANPLNMISFSTLIILLIIIISYISLKYTVWGLRLKAAGENPQSLDSQGINVIKTRYQGVMISGALAGLAGGLFVQQVGTFTANVEGLGFVGIAILISGQWRVQFVVVAALFFAILYSFANNIGIIKISLSEIKPLIQTLPFVSSLIFLTIFSKRSLAPAAVGIPYDRGKR